MLVFPLKKQWYEKIKSGEKTVEYREVKPYWTKRFIKHGFTNFNIRQRQRLIECRLRLGYTKEYLSARIIKNVIVDGKDTDLHIESPVYAIHLYDVKEIKEK